MAGGSGGGGGGGGSRRSSRSSGSLRSIEGAPGGSGGGRSNRDACDLIIDVDLDALQLAELQACRVGETLTIVVQVRGRAQAAVCVRQNGNVVGSLSAFQGLTQLLSCLGQGHGYQVTITQLSRTACHVNGGRVTRP